MKACRFLLTIMVANLGWTSAGFSQWVSIGDGIDYQEFSAAGPNQLYVSRLTRSNPNTTIDTMIANDKMAGSKEIVRTQAAREDDAITWWGQSWGARNKVVAAINGGFYNTTTGVIDGGQIKSGWYAHWFADRGSFSGPAWKLDRTYFHGECVDHTAANVYARFVATGLNMTIDGINQTPGTSDLIIFTPHYDTKTPTGSRTEVLVEMSRPNLTTTGSGYSSGIIRSVGLNTGATWIPFDHLILSAAGSDGTTLKNNASVGAEVRIFQQLIETNEPDEQGSGACATETGTNWGNVFSAINSNYHFLKNNVVRVPDAVAHPGYIGYVNLNPRTAICWNSSYVFFVICDGRSTQSIGMSCETLGNWAKSVLGATDGVNLDGGGSSTMLVNGTVMNVVSDGSERAVCNGVMMVNVQPMQRSTQFTANQTIYTSGAASCRLGPGTNYGIITSIASGTEGTIVNHNIMGVYAKGYYWWKCNFSGTVGWVAESLLTTSGTPNPPGFLQHPSNQTVYVNDNASFTVSASGTTPLSYQWQKSTANISDGGHFSGCTTPTLTITGCSTSDAGSYRCVVTNAYGTATSNAATLTVNVITNLCLQNRDFEEGFTSGIGSGWNKFVLSGAEGTNLAFSDETTEKHSGSHSQEVYSHDVGYDGGVYQRFPAIAGQPYSIQAWVKVYSPQGTNIAEGFIGVDPTGGTTPASGSILWASKPWDYWSSETINVTAQSSYITVYLKGRSTKSATANKVAYVWLDDVTVRPGATTDLAPQVLSPTSICWRWTDLAIETGYRVRDTAESDKSGLLPADTGQWDETALTPNTQYARQVVVINTCGQSNASTGQAAWTLSVAPNGDTIAPSNGTPALNESVTWTAIGGFGAGAVQYYRYAWDQSATHTWTGSETQWTTGTLATSPTGVGTWYLHVQGCNGANVANGTYDYPVTVGGVIIPPDLNADGDVDLADFDLFLPCLSGADIPATTGCENKDFDGDADVDQVDFGIFQRCYSGENVASDPSCMN